MSLPLHIVESLRQAVRPDRLLDTAIRLIREPSPTRDAGRALDVLATVLTQEGFAVQRPAADWAPAPAVVTRYESDTPGPVLQFDCHLDTVHLPFVPPRVADGVLYGSGAADMKGGTAAAVEALRVLRDTGVLAGGSVLLTAHDHHEGPWGDKRQVRALIREGMVGDAVLLPEYFCRWIPAAGKGMAIFQATLERDQASMHEIHKPPDCPDPIAAGVDLVTRLQSLGLRLQSMPAAAAGRDSLFVGQIHAGEIYNQSPRTCRVEGTRRWTEPGAGEAARAELQRLIAQCAFEHGVEATLEWELQGDALRLSEHSEFVQAFQSAYSAETGTVLPFGDKPFIDDGNLYAAWAHVPAITHGPDARGAHTVHEEVPVAELARVARVYALTAVAFCHRPAGLHAEIDAADPKARQGT